MNLEEFKTLWQDVSAAQIVQQRKDSSQIKRIIQGKAKNALEHFSGNILLDMVFLLAFLVVGYTIMWLTEAALIDWVMVVCTAVFIPFFVMFIRHYHFIKNIELQSDSLYQVIEKVVKRLKAYERTYFQASMILTLAVVPIGTALAFYENGMVGGNLLLVWSQSNPQLYAALFSSILLALIVGNYYFTKWYLKKLYSNYIEELQSCLDELVSLQ